MSSSKICVRVLSLPCPPFLLAALVLVLRDKMSVHAGWVDADTPSKYYNISALTKGDNRNFQLVFSDEFEVENRTFDDGHDPKWTALNKNDYTNDALHYYSSDNVRTSNGVLNITTDFRENTFKAFDEDTKKPVAETKHIQTAMVQGWNKFCFTGGIVEFRAKLPGEPQIGGLWPALWLLGNLARATYVGSSDYMWPWSFNKCDPKTRTSQEIDACSKVHHYGLESMVGRGAPEIDVLEAMGGEKGPLPNTPIERPYFSTSLQISPGIRNNRPVLGEQPKKGHWYEGMEYGQKNQSALNPFFYGVALIHKPKSYTYQSDALSSNMQIKKNFFEEHHTYRLEWEPSDLDGNGGYLKWFADGDLIYGIGSSVLNITGAQIPNEPMYIIMNTAVSSSWGFPKPCPLGCDCECYECFNPDCECGLPPDFCSNIPGYFEIDHVRVYQAEGHDKHSVGCSTPSRPTELFIKGHRKRYMNDGDRMPLLPIITGGGVCQHDKDCGGDYHGSCSKKGFCTCNVGFTGPMCLAYVGFDDDPFIVTQPDISADSMMFPTAFTAVAVLLGIGLLLAILLDVKGKVKLRKEYGYQQVSNNTPGCQQVPNETPPTSPVPASFKQTYNHAIISLQNPQPIYQTPAASYAVTGNVAGTNNYIPVQQMKKKVVAYCMIDGRLVD